MGLPSSQHGDPRRCPDACRRDDRGPAPARLRRCRLRERLAGGLIAALACCWLAAAPALAETIRIATYHAELGRKGPGLLLRDLRKGKDAQIAAVARVVAKAAPDILVLQGVDYDYDLMALRALRDRIAEAGPHYPHLFALRPNTGLATGLDLDGDGRLGEPEDAQGYGRFAGAEGMAILSRFPLLGDEARDFSALLWRDLPGADLPETLSDEAGAILRLSRVGHWVVPVQIGETRLELLTFHATPPVFDGPEDFNGRRNHDQIAFWLRYLDGVFGRAPQGHFVLAGAFNLDPVDGEGRRAALTALLGDPRLQDPTPRRTGPVAQGKGQRGDPALDTVAWPEPVPGARRVSYILPSAGLRVIGSGVLWPGDGDPLAETVARASRHRLVWVDLEID